MESKTRFEMPNQLKIASFVMMAVGVIAIAVGFAMDGHRTWASLLINNFFFLAMAVAGTFFLAVHYASNAGWSAGIKRIPEAMGTYIPIAGLIMIIIFLLGKGDLYHWAAHGVTVEGDPHYDEIIANKSAYLNVPFYIIRMVIYIAGWSAAAYFLRKFSQQEDNMPLGDRTIYRRNTMISAIFLVFFAVTSSSSAWDWLMSIDAHWFSTLFGWYVFSGMFVSGLLAITLIAIYLKKRGYLEHVNENHLHDLGKYIFAFSIFWTYLWFSQFMLIWYSNIPEEVTYYVMRWEHYQVMFWTVFIINFVFPILILMTRDAKRKMNILSIIGVILIIGHWLDVYLMVSPGTVGEHAHIGFIEIGMFFGFLGAFVFTVFTALTKASLVPKNDPHFKESMLHHT